MARGVLEQVRRAAAPALGAGRVTAATMVALAAITLSLAAGNDRPPAAATPVSAASRIVSLSPSVTRMLIDMGAGNRVAGVTSYCPAPGPHTKKVGTIVQPSMEAIVALRPDLVVFSREDSATQHADRLVAMGLPVFVLQRGETFEAIQCAYSALAARAGCSAQAAEKTTRYAGELAALKKRGRAVRAAFFISHDPLVAVSSRSFIHRIMADAGAHNVIGEMPASYPIVSAELLLASTPDVIMSILPDAAGFFSALFPAGRSPAAVQKGRVYTVSDAHIPYYTPADYLASVRQIASLLAGLEESP